MKKISNDIRDNILSQIDNNNSDRDISSKISVSRSTIQRIRLKYRPYNIPNKIGRPPKLTPENKRYLVKSVTSGKLDTATSANKQFKSNMNVTVSDQTVRRAFIEAGLVAGVKTTKPLLSKKNISARYEFAKRHINWTINDWESIIWSDETKINRFNSDGRTWCWCKSVNEVETRTVKQNVKHGGGSIMIWGCLTIHGPGSLKIIDGLMVKEKYLDILENELINTIDNYKIDENKAIFMQDNDPKHTAKIIKSWLSSQPFKTLIWPAQSPDLNPIEHLWAWVKSRLNNYDTAPTGILDLQYRVKEVWQTFGVDECRKLIHSMPDRINELYRNKGRWTSY